jgi:Heme NO binding associated
VPNLCFETYTYVSFFGYEHLSACSYTLGGYNLDKSGHYSENIANLLSDIWTFNSTDFMDNFQAAIAGFTWNGNSISSSRVASKSSVTAIADLARPILLLPDVRNASTTNGSGNGTSQAAAAGAASVDASAASWWNGNMTDFVGQLVAVAAKIRQFIASQLTSDDNEARNEQTSSIVILVIVFVLAPIVFLLIYRMTLTIQNYALGLSEKTKELRREKKRSDTLLYQMLPKSVALQLKLSKKVLSLISQSAISV